jgi:triacylglycerol esterase/lipase EstA (alpha/beta hydrolase family)
MTITAESDCECVILLHGLGRTAASMGKIEKKLTESGFRVWNRTYPSRRFAIEELAEPHIRRGLQKCQDWGATRIHFVTHSLGGILVREYLQTRRIQQLDKIIMLAPPNHGSEVADRLKDNFFFKHIMGPAGQQLATGKNGKSKSFKPIPGIIGVLAGKKSYDPWFSGLFSGPNDGKVSVESTKLEEMKDFLQVNHNHTFMQNGKDVIEQILYFLKNAEFRK